MSNSGIARRKQKISPLPYILLIPMFALLGMFSFYPFIKTVISSFAVTSETGEFMRWAGLINWKELFSARRFKIAMGNTFRFAALNLIFTLVPAMVLALIGCRRGKGQRLVTTLFALPLSISTAASSVVWAFILASNDFGGVLNAILHTDMRWLGDKRTALLFVSLVTSWTHVASCYIYLLAGFRNVSEDLIEAATLDGAGAFTRATRIMIPMASPQIFFVLILSVNSALQTFTQIKLLTNGGPGFETLNLTFEIYVQSQIFSRYEAACCMSVVLFLVVLLFTLIQFAFEKKAVFYR